MRKFIIALALAFPAAIARAQVAVPGEMQSATLQASRQIDFVSNINGENYRLKIALPFAAAPQGGYGVLYVLDGDNMFDTYAEAARRYNVRGHGFRPTVVVGIGYRDPDMDMFRRRRTYDFTAEADVGIPPADCVDRPPPVETCPIGGAAKFLEVMQNEVRPRVAAIVPLDEGHTALLGHSLGGLFAVRTLLEHPNAFTEFIILSPAIWPGDRAVIREEPAFVSRLSEQVTKPRVFVAVGGLEQTPPVSGGSGLQTYIARIKKTQLIDNAAAFATWLKDVPGIGPTRVVFRIYDGQTYPAVPWAAVNDALGFALAQQ